MRNVENICRALWDYVDIIRQIVYYQIIAQSLH